MRKLYYWLTLLLLTTIACTTVHAATVAVHDPSIIVVYRDANGNSYPENNTAGTRTKYYYIFGTQLGAAYSRDMINWTPFTPSFSVNGNITTNYRDAFREAADWSRHTSSGVVRENLWAPDIIYNKAMGKWCLYYSVNGPDWLSSVTLHTADRIEGPYQYAGMVVASGMDRSTSGIGNQDYQRVTGSSTIPNRYLDNNGQWTGTYGTSCIDPSVLYDENGALWMNYGSWSGGIFLLKLNEQTGLRDYNYSYGNSPVWDGGRLRRDPYMGIHIAGGYYVSGEGPYIEYIKDKNGVGYYYMFISMGFYSPEGGYTMRVFRSQTLDGIYRDVSGNDAVFDRYIFNYGNNVTYGFPIMQNYRWNWWSVGQTAQGHNSVLQEEDGKSYLIYHTKYDNNTVHHNVEVHQLFHNEQGWIVAAPFEYREGFGVSSKAYSREDIAGLYGVITHNPVDYENLATNREQQLYVNADGTLTGAYTGTWTYNFAEGSQYITLTTNAGTFRGVLSDQLMDGISTKTISFTAMNSANERALWGYRYTNTLNSNTNHYIGDELITIGTPNYDLAFDAYDEYHQETVSGDFEVEFTFDNYTLAQENWHNWALVLGNGTEYWHLRADAYSNTTFTGSIVNYNYNWNWDTEFKDVFKDKEVQIKVTRIGTTINVFASVENNIVFTASAKNTPAGNYTIYLGGESTYLEVKKVSVGQYGTRQTVGTITADGRYTAAFNALSGQGTTVSGDFELNYHFHNYRNPVSTDNWDNYILRANSGGNTMLLRADAFALDVVGEASYSQNWNWDNFLSIMAGAEIDLNINREQDVITYTFDIVTLNGENYTYTMTNTNAPTTDITYSFTVEEAMVDIIEVENVNRIGEEIVTDITDMEITDHKESHIYGYKDALYIQAEKEGQGIIYSVDGRAVRAVEYKKGTNKYYGLAPGMYILNRTKFLIN